jgi:hypothetical protein
VSRFCSVFGGVALLANIAAGVWCMTDGLVAFGLLVSGFGVLMSLGIIWMGRIVL